jgi:hypothetical protein
MTTNDLIGLAFMFLAFLAAFLLAWFILIWTGPMPLRECINAITNKDEPAPIKQRGDTPKFQPLKQQKPHMVREEIHHTMPLWEWLHRATLRLLELWPQLEYDRALRELTDFADEAVSEYLSRDWEYSEQTANELAEEYAREYGETYGSNY